VIRALVILSLAALAAAVVPRSTPQTFASSGKHVRVCAAVKHGFARCNAILVLNASPAAHRPKPTATNTSIRPTATNTTVRPTATSTSIPPTATNTSILPTTTNTTVPPTATNTSIPPTATNTSIPPTATNTSPSPTATATAGTGSTCVTPGSPPSGYGACDLQSAYSLTTASANQGSTQTVAVIEAFDDPTAEADLGVYRSKFGLPPCTTANGCFKKIDQNGGTSYPATNTSWAQEMSLDMDMVSAICPNCHILLVEANDAGITNLGTAVNTAASHGATEISNSYGGSESSSDTSYDSTYFNHPGIPITASTGDGGYGVQYPAASQYVTAVGGTSLSRNSGTSRGWSETAWSCSAGFGCLLLGGPGSGCSTVDPEPAWQKIPANNACSMRTIADVSAVADPSTGVAVYDSTPNSGSSGWQVFGGTSVSAPIIAGVYALAGNGSSVTYGSYPYSHTSSLNDVTSGSNGSCGNYLCNAQAGYDGPTGLGTPNGTAGF
jgi:hypothetical protein